MFSTKARARLLVGAALVLYPAIAHAGQVAGTVSDASGTRNLPSAQVSIVELGRSVEADSAGQYRFSDVPTGRYTLRVRYTGADAIDTPIMVDASGMVTQDVAVGGGGDILVTGQRANLASSLSRQRGADGVESVLTRDSIGQFPDQNAAESVRRAPGVNVLNDQGEGRFVAVRGLDPSLNAASINGVRVPAPEADTRSVALDVVASELIESIEIKKSLTPDMDGDTIGASVEINTTSAFDRKKDLLAGSIEGSYNHYSGEVTPKGSVNFSKKFADNLGISGGASYYLRKFETDNIEMDGWTTDDAGNGFADAVEYRDYDVRRLRTGGSLSLDWQPAPSTRLYARGIYNRFSDQEDRRRLIFEMDADPASSTASGASFDSADGRIRVERDLKDRFEKQVIQSYSVGGETETGPWRLRYSAAWSRASELESGSIDPITFRRDFDGEDGDDLSVAFDYGDYLRPRFAVGGASAAAFDDAAEYGFDSFDRTTLSRSVDREWNFRGDVTRSFALAEGTFELQAGGKARLRQKTYDLQVDTFDGYDGDFTLADVVGRQTYRLADLGSVVAKKGERGFLDANAAAFERDSLGSDFASLAEDYAVGEDIYSGYLLGRYQAGPVRLIGGVRMEHTRNDIRGSTVTLNEDGDPGEQLLVTANRIRRSYTNWLPSAVVRYEATPELVLRAGAFRSLVRPSIGQLAPRFALERDGDDLEGAFGNPDLKPYRAWNLDAGAEWYFDTSSVLQAGFFYKDIQDYITTVTFEGDDAPYNGSYRGIAFTEADIPLNSGKARIRGVELGFSQLFRMLPAPFDGLLTNLNYTFTDADGETFDGDTGGLRTIPLPASSRHTFNAVLGYEKGPVSVRLAGTYRDKYLDEVQAVADEDRYVRQHFQLDASARYRITPNLQLFGEWVNINDAKYVAYQNAPVTRRLLQYEEYGYTLKFGVRANF
ncbi:TonB-dependent receptor [Sphingomonas sp. RRHST34]|uniref:TonB-dependent receptor n=1 Tax=Sphingomonas citri TaxID=2862499 RepID=A0ABS7BM97_9SPHN|nr:TonB-dependent receptor [Sphingomonas citri]MBW6530711.1 TonB-dependent receptor [Sphingomonas citri]